MTQPHPIHRPEPAPHDRDRHDRDWRIIRDTVIDELDVPWTDHNLPDPGVTLLEAASMALADIHYRIAERRFSDHHVGSRTWQPGHWTGVDLGTPASLGELADELAADSAVTPGTPAAHDLWRVIANSPDRRSAISAVIDQGLTSTWEIAAAMVRLARQPAVLRAALDLRPVVAGAIDDARRRKRGERERVSDAAAVRAALRFVLDTEGLWDEELDDLIRLEMRRRRADQLGGLAEQIRSDSQAGTDIITWLETLYDELAGLDTDPGDVVGFALAGLAYHPCPTGWAPEGFELPNGSSRIWPPHALQTRLTEPVTGNDYAGLARSHPSVDRAWTLPGRYAGIGWDGVAVDTDEPEALGAVTIVVDPKDGQPEDDVAFLREVLGTLAGPGELAEADHPFQPYRADLGAQTPRRMICDEVGAALIRRCGVVVKAVLHVAVGAVDDRSIPIDAAAARMDAYFAVGRPESQPDTSGPRRCPTDLDGPWPLASPAPAGWIPGEPVRLTELIEVLSDDPYVLGVEDVQIRLESTDEWFPVDGSEQPLEFAIDAICVPELAAHCVTVTFDAGGTE